VSNRDDLATVIALACLTEDRSNAEQLALLRVADKVDLEFNQDTVTNQPPGSSRLVDEVMGSRVLDDGQREVRLKNRKGAPR